MDGETVTQSVGISILIIPLVTVGSIILAAMGCIASFFLLRGLLGWLGKAGGKVKDKASKFGKEVKQEANRLSADRV